MYNLAWKKVFGVKHSYFLVIKNHIQLCKNTEKEKTYSIVYATIMDI